MYRLISKLVVFKNLGEDSLLQRLAEVITNTTSLIKAR